MTNEDTFSLLKECDAGVKMATDSLDDVRDYAKTPEMRALLNTSRQQHEWIGREVQDMLLKCGGKEKEPHPVARKMASMKTNAKLTVNNSEQNVAELIADGCDMGVKSLNGYLEQYKGAEVPARALCRTLVAVEQQLGTEIRQFF